MSVTACLNGAAKNNPHLLFFFFIRPPCSRPKLFSHIHLSSWIFCFQSPVQTPLWRCAVQPRLQSWKFKSNKTSSLFFPAFRILSRIDFIFLLQYIWADLLLRSVLCLPRPIRVVSKAIPPHTGWQTGFFFSSSESRLHLRLKHSQPRNDRITRWTQCGPQCGKTLLFMVNKATKRTVWTFIERLL